MFFTGLTKSLVSFTYKNGSLEIRNKNVKLLSAMASKPYGMIYNATMNDSSHGHGTINLKFTSVSLNNPNGYGPKHSLQEG